MPYPISIKGVLLVDGKVSLVCNDRDEWELPACLPAMRGQFKPGASVILLFNQVVALTRHVHGRNHEQSQG